MRVLIRRLENKKGTTTFVDRTVDAPSLRIGRGTDQELQLSDMRVALAHAEIEPFQGGPYRIEAKTANGVWVNGGPCPGSRLDFNDTIDCGHYRLTILKPDFGVDLAILVEEQSLAADRPGGSGSYVTELRNTRLSRRGLAWAGFLLVLLTMLVIPLSVRYGTSSAGAPGQPQAKALAWPNDEVWNSGTISSTHAYFETDCASCHVEPFTQVRNDACLACHDTIHHHAHDPELLALDDFSGAMCTDCHHEHNGPDGTLVRLPSLCTDCHASPQERFPGTKLESVRSFSNEHPAFSPLVTQYDPSERKFSAAPVAQGRNALLKEDTNLKFPHDLHLAGKGVDAPEGKRVLACADCHVPDRGEISFEPVTMERHCADCHRLEFDKELPDRVVPHGKPADVAGVIRDQTAAKALTGKVKALGTLPVTPDRRRPGPRPAPVMSKEALATWSEQQGDQRVREMFEGRLCSKCHIVSPTQDEHLPYAIALVAMREHTMNGAWFNHKPHALTPCADCHEADKSSTSSDVLLPDIANCRGCHGDIDGSSQVRSACIDCHEYHLSDAPLWDKNASQRKRDAETAHKALMTRQAGGTK